MMIDVTTVLGLIGGGTGVAAVIVAVSSRRKTKADALAVIEAAAAAQVVRMEQEVERWKKECCALRDEMVREAERWIAERNALRDEIEELRQLIDNNLRCQTDLQAQIDTLTREKATLIDKVNGLMHRIEDLELENKCLREKRANVPA